MTTGRKVIAALILPLLVIGLTIAVQGCGGGTEKKAETTTQEAAKPAAQAAGEQAGEMEKEAERHTAELAVDAYTCPMHPEATSLEPGKCGICGMELVKTKAEYTCTMCPDVHEHQPGKCPKCGVDLVLRPISEEGEEEEEAGHEH